MSSIVVAGDTSGSVTLSAPAVAGSTVLTLPAVSGTVLTNTTAGLQANNIDEYNANTTLTSGNFGRLITSNTATATTLTLPLASSGAVGSIMSFSNLNSGLLTITAVGSDIIFVNGAVVTTFTVPNGSSIQLAASGAGYWKTLTGMTGGLGVAQTWQNVSASRGVGTTYTNSTGKPIQVSVFKGFSSPSTNTDLTLTVAGISISYQSCYSTAGGNWGLCVTGVVPNGATYSIASSGVAATLYWNELR